MQKKNRDSFWMKHKTNDFNKPQSLLNEMILQEIDKKIISLNYQVKVHKTNPVWKQEAVIKYLNELHKKVCPYWQSCPANCHNF